MEGIEKLANGPLVVLGQLAVASNATLFVEIDGVPAVYKPIAGEQPLWDFPDGTLAYREVAAYQLSEALSWGIVPPTLLREGPYGMGAVQLWIDIDEDVDLVALIQSDDPRLARIALFDAVINNTDRKGSHLLPAQGEIYGCDHGVTFHTEDKLRTVLWQWCGQEIPTQWLIDLANLDLEMLALPVSEDEVKALQSRISRLLATRTFPMPNPAWPAVPWPPI